jgi:hypothetical protein
MQMYDTTLGRWTQADPEQYIDGTDLYQLSFSNPLAFLDPSGLAATTQPTSQPSTQPVYNVSNGGFSFNMAPSTPQAGIIGGKYGMYGFLGFLPNDKCPKCKSVGFVQTIRVTNLDDPTLHYYPDPLAGLDKQLATQDDPNGNIDGGTIVDFDPLIGGKGSATPYYRQNFGGTKGTRDGSSGVFGINPAIIRDAPRFPQHVLVEIETVAVCEDTGQTLGSVRWGYSYDGTNVAMSDPSASDDPTPSWKAAYGKFLAWNSK